MSDREKMKGMRVRGRHRKKYLSLSRLSSICNRIPRTVTPLKLLLTTKYRNRWRSMVDNVTRDKTRMMTMMMMMSRHTTWPVTKAANLL